MHQSKIWSRHLERLKRKEGQEQICSPLVERNQGLCPEVQECQSFYRTQVNLGSDSWVRMSVSESTTCIDLADVTLADEDTNSILADNANRAM